MKDLLRNIRFYTLIASLGLSLFFLIFIKLHYESARIETIRFQQYSALTAVLFLYLALLAGPFCYVFKFFPFRPQYTKARRALGVSAFYFGLLHAVVSFFGQLGGFGGLAFLSSKYILAISLSFTALVVLFFMALTSFDSVIEKMSYKKWKILHRCVYLAGFFIIIHALMLGTHFQVLSGVIPQIFFTILFFLLGLEALRIDFFLSKKISFYSKAGFVSSAVLILFILWILLPYVPQPSGLSFGIHSQHIKQALEKKSGGASSVIQKRYSVQLVHDQTTKPGESSKLSFEVSDAATGERIREFDELHEKLMHVIVVDEELLEFHHIHPELKDGIFTVDTVFDHAGPYRIYTDFQPRGGEEQQVAFKKTIDGEVIAKKNSENDEKILEKKSDGYKVKLGFSSSLLAQDLDHGKGRFTFEISNLATGQGVTTLRPYLGAFGHLIMINTATFQYIHVHPVESPADLGPNGGPTISFIPLSLYEPVRSGVYRLFAEFNPDGKLIRIPFTVKVQ